MIVATKNCVKLIVNVGDVMTVKYKGGEERKIQVKHIHADELNPYIKAFDLVKNANRSFTLANLEILD